MTIAITGIVAGMVVVFLRQPIDAFVDTGRRAEMSDTADGAIRRMVRDVRRAAPNTLRVLRVGSIDYVEFIPARAGARYRFDNACFTSGCSSLTTMGSLVDDASGLPRICTGVGTPAGCPAADRIIVFNPYNNAAGDCSVANPSAYCEFVGGDPAATVTGVTPAGDADVVQFVNSRFRPGNGSAAARFQIAEQPVTYACDPISGTITRFSGYGVQAVQPTPPLGGQSHLLARGISACAMTYASGAFERWALLAMQFTLTQAGESATFYQEVHVDNAP